MLIAAGADVNQQEELYTVTLALDMCLSSERLVSVQGTTAPFGLAVYDAKRLDLADMLLEAGADIDARSGVSTPIVLVCSICALSDPCP